MGTTTSRSIACRATEIVLAIALLSLFRNPTYEPRDPNAAEKKTLDFQVVGEHDAQNQEISGAPLKTVHVFQLIYSRPGNPLDPKDLLPKYGSV